MHKRYIVRLTHEERGTLKSSCLEAGRTPASYLTPVSR
jgi:hypothetical protein